MNQTPEANTTGQRFQVVLEEHFRGNQSLMARGTGLSQASIGRITRGRQVPTLPLVANLAEHHDVNPLWLITGKGPRRLSDAPAGHVESRLPVARRILPKPPQEQPSCAIAYEIDVAQSVFATSRYGLEIQSDDPVVQEQDQRLRSGDIVVLETDPEYWQADLQRLRGKLVAVRLHQEQGVSLLLGRAFCEFDSSDEPCRFFVDVFGVGRVPLQVGTATMPAGDADVSIDEDQGKAHRAIEIDKTPSSRSRRKAMPEAEPELHKVTATVIAVAIQLLREL